MPISVACPHCQARLAAPDAAAGKQVKCAKCQQLIQVPGNDPGYEVVEDAPPKPAAPAVARRATPIESPRPRPRAVEDDDEDERPSRKPSREDDEDGEHPRSRSRADDDEDDEEDGDRPAKPKKKKKSNLPLLIVGLSVGLFLCAGCGLGGLYMLAKPADDKVRFPGGGGPVAAGGGGGTFAIGGVNWVPFEGPDKNFLAKFPNAAPEKKDPLAEITDPEQRKLVQEVGKIDLWARVDGGRTYSLSVHALPLVPPPAQVKRMLDGVVSGIASSNPGGQLTQVDSTSGEWKGYPFKQVTFKNPAGQIVLTRAIIGKGTLYVLSVEGGSGLSSTDKVAGEFFDAFEPKPLDPPGAKKGGETPKGTGPSGGFPKKKTPKK